MSAVATVSGVRPGLVRDVLLRDGSTLRLQAPTPADYEDVKAFYDRLSPDSRHLRFHGYARTDVVARADVEASGVDRLALIARHDGRVVAVARYEGLREPGVAEVAFAVADGLQRQGIGTRMLEQLAAIASERGIHRFDAEVLAGNALMLGVFEHAGFAVRRQSHSGELTVSLDITPTEVVRERIDERDHFAAIASLRAVLAPSAVAVLGATPAPGSLGRKVMENIIAGGFQGVVTPVNRDRDVICSIAAASSFEELPVAPDLAIIAASGEELLEFAAEAAGTGARAMLVISAGPEYDGEAPGALKERLLEIVRGAGMRLVGPHSLGVVNTDPEISLNATFSGASVTPGALGICSQSAAPGVGLLGHAAARRLGVSTLVSLGDRADVSTNDLLEYFEEDQRTAAVMLYLETFGNPEHFTRIAQRVSRNKPILALKGRRHVESPRGEIQSDTAAALRGDAVVDALLHQAGVLRLRSGEELFDAAEFFACQPLPSGRQIAIITNSAGLATLATDACATRGLQIARGTTAANPLVFPVSASVDEYAASIPKLLADPGIDALMVCYVDLSDDPASVLAATSAASAAQAKPVVASVVRSDGHRPLRRPPSHARCRPRGSQLPVPRLVRRRARARCRTPRVAIAPPRRAPALQRLPIRHGARIDLHVSRPSARWRLAHARGGRRPTGHARHPDRRLAPLPRARAGNRSRGRPRRPRGPESTPAGACPRQRHRRRASRAGRRSGDPIRLARGATPRTDDPTGMARGDHPTVRAGRGQRAGRGNRRSRSRPGTGRRPRRTPSTLEPNRGVPATARNRHGGRRADRQLRRRRDPAGQHPRQRKARPQSTTRTDPALRAPAPRNPGDRRGRPQPRPLHNPRLRRTRHTTANRASSPGRARQDLVALRPQQLNAATRPAPPLVRARQGLSRWAVRVPSERGDVWP